jgi:uncharacterized repeat protein (TIGR03943 family)
VTLDETRLIRLAALTAWAALFDTLWLTGEWTRFVGPRTAWVVPFGAVALTLLALANIAIVISRGPSKPVGRAELIALAVLFAPVAALAVVPSASLGSLAVDRKEGARDLIAAQAQLKAKERAGDDIVLATPYGREDRPDEVAGAYSPPTTGLGDPPPQRQSASSSTPAPTRAGIMEIAAADQVPDSASTFGVVEGAPAGFVAFVSSPPPTRDASFEVSRFYTSCCAADAVPVTVEIVPAATLSARYSADQWLRLNGTLKRSEDGGYHLAATTITPAPEPANPYLAPF